MEALRTYFDSLMEVVRLSTWIVHEQLAFRQIDEYAAYVKGELYLYGGFVLHVAEFASVRDGEMRREKYRYHLQDAHQRQVARWDNAPHHPDLPGFPHHRHGVDDRAEPSAPMNLGLVIEQLDGLLSDL